MLIRVRGKVVKELFAREDYKSLLVKTNLDKSFVIHVDNNRIVSKLFEQGNNVDVVCVLKAKCKYKGQKEYYNNYLNALMGYDQFNKDWGELDGPLKVDENRTNSINQECEVERITEAKSY